MKMKNGQIYLEFVHRILEGEIVLLKNILELNNKAVA